MDLTFKTPIQIFINNKFYCIAETVEVKENSPEFRKSILPDNVKLDPSQFTGVVVNIKKNLPTKDEKEEVAKEKSKKDYDEFYRRMVYAKDNPDAHLPII